jgi:hypothetical protein
VSQLGQEVLTQIVGENTRVPEPGTSMLLATGINGLAGMRLLHPGVPLVLVNHTGRLTLTKTLTSGCGGFSFTLTYTRLGSSARSNRIISAPHDRQNFQPTPEGGKPSIIPLFRAFFSANLFDRNARDMQRRS